MHAMEDPPVIWGIALRSLLVLVLVEAHRPITVAELVVAVERSGFQVEGRSSKTVSDALRWEVARGRVLRFGRGRYVAGYVAPVTRHRMRRRVECRRRGQSWW